MFKKWDFERAKGTDFSEFLANELKDFVKSNVSPKEYFKNKKYKS